MTEAHQIATALLDGDESFKDFVRRRNLGKTLHKGDAVFVAPTENDVFDHEFIGHVVGFRNKYVTVADQEDNWFDVLPNQAVLVKKAGRESAYY